jgi:hypothetical protein
VQQELFVLSLLVVQVTVLQALEDFSHPHKIEKIRLDQLVPVQQELFVLSLLVVQVMALQAKVEHFLLQVLLMLQQREERKEQQVLFKVL